jgi:hypothetical protein
MSQDGYGLRISFNSPAAMGRGIDVAVRALMEAGVPMQLVGDYVAIKRGEARDLTDT